MYQQREQLFRCNSLQTSFVYIYGADFPPFYKNINLSPFLQWYRGYLMSISFLHLVKNIRVISFLEGHDRRALKPVEDVFAE